LKTKFCLNDNWRYGTLQLRGTPTSREEQRGQPKPPTASCFTSSSTRAAAVTARVIQPNMIPKDAQDFIFPELVDGTSDAAILEHDCGINFQFRVESVTGDSYVITTRHLRSWRTTIDKIAECAGSNCFSYNTLQAKIEGVYHTKDNTLAILFSPATFLEHNDVEGIPVLLLLGVRECILTGSKSAEGQKLIAKYRKKAIAKHIVTIDSKWRKWISLRDAE
jgi:hypothetical protein